MIRAFFWQILNVHFIALIDFNELNRRSVGDSTWASNRSYFIMKVTFFHSKGFANEEAEQNHSAHVCFMKYINNHRLCLNKCKVNSNESNHLRKKMKKKVT